MTFAHLNRTAADEARGSFAYDGLGQFTLNLKCIATEDEDISYIEVRWVFLIVPNMKIEHICNPSFKHFDSGSHAHA